MKLTVALPIYNAKDIAWLCLESLNRQRDVDFDWELIVYEELHEQQLGPEFFRDFGVGASRVLYNISPDKKTLGEKWSYIPHWASKESEVMVFCAADNYYHPHMLRDSVDAIERGYDWFYTTKGYFYDFNTKRILLYSARRETGLQMAASMEIAKRIPNSPRKRIVDLWLKRNMKPENPLIDTSDHWEGTLFTHGYNTISSQRGKYFINPKYPFRETSTRLEEIVPEIIGKRINSMK